MNSIIMQSPVLSDVSFIAETYYDMSTISSNNWTSTIRQDNTGKQYICVYGVYNSKIIVQFSTLSTTNTMIRFYNDYGQAPIYIGVDSNWYLRISSQEIIKSIISKFAIGTLS